MRNPSAKAWGAGRARMRVRDVKRAAKELERQLHPKVYERLTVTYGVMCAVSTAVPSEKRRHGGGHGVDWRLARRITAVADGHRYYIRPASPGYTPPKVHRYHEPFGRGGRLPITSKGALAGLHPESTPEEPAPARGWFDLVTGSRYYLSVARCGEGQAHERLLFHSKVAAVRHAEAIAGEALVWRRCRGRGRRKRPKTVKRTAGASGRPKRG